MHPIAIIGFFFLTTSSIVCAQSSEWEAPSNAGEIHNPFGNIVEDKDGALLFKDLCEVCHGKKGKGDGIAGITLNPRPADLTKPVIQQQKDGEIFWKITEGKAPMASYKDVLSAEERWHLVNYIRQLGGKNP